VRELPRYLNPRAEHLIELVPHHDAPDRDGTDGPRASKRGWGHGRPNSSGGSRGFLWHGNVFRALQVVGELEIDLDDAGATQAKLVKAVAEFGGYMRANAGSIPNYGERYRNDEAISNAFVESAVNQVVSKRMVKKQQMRWSQRGAHLLLQIRTRVLNEDLAGDFRRWCPAFMPASERQDVAA